jgi:chromosome segregation ATPase
MSTRDEYVAAAKQRLDDWNTEMDTLEAKAQQAREDDKARYQELLTTLRAKREEGERQLAAIKAASEDSWKQLKAGSDKVWEAFTDSVAEFKSHFN